MSMRNVQIFDVIVIGGGAAGMFAAIHAGRAGKKVALLEPNGRLGKKLLITGKGRCNVTNHCSAEEILRNIPRNGKFLYSAMNGCDPSSVMAFFESAGCPLKTERGNRVFPVSDQSATVLNALQEQLKKAAVRIFWVRAMKITADDTGVTGVQTEQGFIAAKHVILATGGMSYPATGSTGDGYTMAKELGHTVVEPEGSLVPLETLGRDCQDMQGLSLRNVGVKLLDGKGKVLYKDFGELLFTHFGVSGPLVLSASAHMRSFDKCRYRLEIDLKPALDEKKLDARLLRDFEKYANREFKNALNDLAGQTMIPTLIRLSGIPEDTRVNSITRAQRMALLHLLKAFPVSVSGTRPIDEAIVTSGGVCTREINPRTMESKLVSGLYFAGEVLDLDGYTGGFNLQIAWSTGYVAGNSV